MKIEVEVKTKKYIDIKKGDLINDHFLIVSIGDNYVEMFSLETCALIRQPKERFVKFIDTLFNSHNLEKRNVEDIIYIVYANDEE